MKQGIKAFIKSNGTLLPLVKKFQGLKQQYKKPIRGKNNVISNKGNCTNVKFDIEGDNNSVEIQQGSVLSGLTIFIRGNNHRLIIHENCYYKAGSITFEDENGKVIIGKNTSIESALIGVTEPNKSIIIGENCMFSTGIELRTGDSHSIIDTTTNKRINYAADIEVGNHVWIGANSIILKGVKLGDNCIIGTNSVVTKNVPPNTIAAGIPAKVIKENVSWLRERIYEK